MLYLRQRRFSMIPEVNICVNSGTYTRRRAKARTEKRREKLLSAILTLCCRSHPSL